MRNNYLLPNKYKKVGMWMFVPFCLMCLLCLLSGDLEFNYINIPALALLVEDFPEKHRVFEIVQNDPINEIAMLGLLVSLCLISLSKEKDEDEMTGQIRMSSFVWSLWTTAGILAFGVIFIYGFSFLYFCFGAIYLVFLLYIIKFNISMRRVRREAR